MYRDRQNEIDKRMQLFPAPHSIMPLCVAAVIRVTGEAMNY